MAINKIITKPPKSHSGLKNCLAYVLRSDKTEQTLTAITGPYHHKELNANLYIPRPQTMVSAKIDQVFRLN